MKAIVSKNEAMEILGISERLFYATINEPGSKVVPSIRKGKYSYRSVLREFERIHGFPYREAVVDK